MSGSADAFALGDGPDACVLLHGLTGSPAEIRPVGEALARAGVRAIGPLLPGHGTSPEDLYVTTRGDLLNAAESALLSAQGARRLFVCGLSAGALLALHLAARRDLPEIAGLALLAPAIEFKGATWIFANVFGRLPALPFIVRKGSRDVRKEPDDRAAVPDAYAAIPLRWGPELLALSRGAMELAPRVRAPALILHGALDRTSAPDGSPELARRLGSSRVELRILPRSGHVLPLDLESAEVCRSIVAFFQGLPPGAD